MWSEDLNSDIRPYHLAPLVSAFIVIAAYLDRSDAFQTTMVLLNILLLPFVTGAMYAYSLDYSDRTWKSVILGSWPTVVAIILVTALLTSVVVVLFVSPVLFLMASLGGILTRLIHLQAESGK